MTIHDVTSLIGGAAAMCTTLSFVPQLVKIRRQGGRDLSYTMLLLYLLGLSLWLVYGLRIQAIEVIAANVVGGTLVVAAIAMKRRAQQQEANGGPTCRRS
jgi:MtN3 and saliva related transmembrane protein